MLVTTQLLSSHPVSFRRAPLWATLGAAQLVDIAWAGFILIGVEKVSIEPGFLAASDLNLYHMPWTHSLAMTPLWGLAGALLFAMLKRSAGLGAAMAVGLVVMSHWFADLLVHTEDLPIYPGGEKVGFGLWRSMPMTIALELGLLTAGFLFYLWRTRPKGSVGRITPWIFLAFLFGLNIYNWIVPAEPDPRAFAVTGLAAFVGVAVVGGQLSDRFRTG